MKKIFSLLIRSGFIMLTTFHSKQVVAQQWSLVGGITAQDIAVGKNGKVWATGTNNSIYRWNNSSWETMTGGASRIAVDTSGDAWVVNAGGDIYKYQSGTNNWQQIAGKAKDIAVGANGTVWIIGIYPVQGGYEVYKRNGSGWNKIAGGAERIAVDPYGMAWITNNTNNIFQFNGASFVQKDGAAKDLSIGADGSLWCANTADNIYRWNGANWDLKTGGGSNIAVAPDGNAWVVNAAGQVWKTADASTAVRVLFPRGQYYEHKILHALRVDPYLDQVAGQYAALDPLGKILGKLSLLAAEIYSRQNANATAQSVLDSINFYSHFQQGVSGVLAILVMNEISRRTYAESELLSVTSLKNWVINLYKSFKIRCAKSVLDQYKIWKNDPCSYQAEGYTRPVDCGLAGLNIATLLAGRTPPQDIISKAGLKSVFGNNAGRLASGISVGMGSVLIAASAVSTFSALTATFTASAAAAGYAATAGINILSPSLVVAFGNAAAATTAVTTAGVSTATTTTAAIGAAGWAGVVAAPISATIMAVVVGTIEGIRVTEILKVEPMLKMKLGAAMSESINLTNVLADSSGRNMLFLAFMEAAIEKNFTVTEPRIDGEARFYCQAGFVSRFNLSYTLNGQTQTHTTADLAVGHEQSFTIPYNATNIRSEGYYSLSGWNRIYNVSLAQPTYICFTTYGTIVGPNYKTDCPEVGNMTTQPNQLTVTHGGAYVGWIRVTYQENGQTVTKLEKSNATAGWREVINIPTAVSNIRLEAWSATGWIGEPWKKIIDKTWAVPPGECIKIYGTTLDPRWNNECN